jgi:2-phosphosulfolactate phosphatase
VIGVTDQDPHDVRFDWGMAGLAALRGCRTFVIVDILSFTTCVSIVVERGASVLPFHVDDAEAARSFALENGAILAGRRGTRPGYSLSPASLQAIPAQTRLVLPSPNGSALSMAAAGMGTVLAGCFRNRTAVAELAMARGGPIAVIAAGERWDDGSLRPCFEDLCGAGAILARLRGSLSPEASVAAAAFAHAEGRLGALLADCASGRELLSRGFEADVRLAAALDASPVAPELRDRAFGGHRTTEARRG